MIFEYKPQHKEVGVIRDIAMWPAVRDVVWRLDLSQPYINRLIRLGRLRAVRTRLGFLVDPESVAAFEAERARRQKGRVAEGRQRAAGSH
jgi:hypothetical protein